MLKQKSKKSKLDELKEWITKASSQVKINGINTLAYEFWFSPDNKIVHYYNRFLNSEALIFHMNNISPMLSELLKLATPKKSLFMVMQTNVLKKLNI